MTAFEEALSFTLKWEGGKADNPNDSGGRTNMGVTQRTFDAHRDAIGQPRDDVFNITKDEAAEIAKVRYWDAMGLDDIAETNPKLAVALFDWGFHSGTQNVINRTAGMTTASEVLDARMQFLTGLRDFNHFGRGWVRRVEDLRAFIGTDETPSSPDVEMIQVFDGGTLLATFHPAAVTIGRTNAGRTKIMVRFK